MTHYTVIWEEDANSDPAGIWLESSDRNAITAAAHAIDQDLAENASLKGNELSEGLRTLSISGLRVCPITLAGRDAPAFAEYCVARRR